MTLKQKKLIFVLNITSKLKVSIQDTQDLVLCF